MKYAYWFILFFFFLASCSNQPENQIVAVSTAASSAIATQISTPTTTQTPAPTATPSQTSTATTTPTTTATSTPTPLPTPTAVGGQVRAYNERYIYLDDGHEEPAGIALPTTKLALPGFANFLAWSPDYLWLASLQSTSIISPVDIREDRLVLHRVRLHVSNLDSSETRELAQFTIPQISNYVQIEVGRGEPIGDYLYQGNFVVWSPDGSRLAYLNYLAHEDTTDIPIRFEIMVVSIAGGEAIKVGETTFSGVDPSYDMRPLAWSPDGSQIAYTSYGDEDFGLHIVNADGSEDRRVLTLRYLSLPYWRNEGQTILLQHSQYLSLREEKINGVAYRSFLPASGQLIEVNSDGTNLTTLNDNVFEPVLSPDGTMVAYEEMEQIKVLILADGTEQVVAHVCGYLGGYRIRWSPDSQAVAYQTRQVLERDGQFGCAFSSTYTYVGVSSTEGEEIALITYESLMVTYPHFAFSPDGNWFAVTQGVLNNRMGSIRLLNMSDSTVSSTRIESPLYGIIAWQAKY